MAGHFVCPFTIRRTFQLFPSLGCCDHSCMGCCVNICFLSLRRSGVAGSHGNSTFNILRNCQTVFQTGYTKLCSHLQCMGIPISLCLDNTNCLPLKKNFSRPGGCEVVSTVVLVCISLGTDNVEHPFMCFLAICVASLKKYLCRPLAHF